MISAALLATLLLGLWLAVRIRKRFSMPPGEWGWPILGHLPPSDEPMDETIKKLRKKHGDVFTWKIGTATFVVLCDFDTIKKVYNHPDAQGRPSFYSLLIFSCYKNLGLANSVGEIWHGGRRFTIRHLRDMGMGRSSLESRIALEAHNLVENFKKVTDVATEVPRSLSIAILNIIWELCAGKRHDLDDEKALEFQQVVVDIFHDFQGNVVIFDTFPFLLPITPRFVMEKLGVTKYMEDCDILMSHMKKCIKEHKESLDVNNPRDYIDAFLIEMQLEKNAGSAIFTEENLMVSLGDIFTAASEITSITLRWLILYMIKHPEIQRKIQAEIDSVVPRDRLPGLDDRPSLSYLEATLYEVERLVSVVPLLVPHCATQDIEVNGFHVPKGTVLMGHAGSCHGDPQVWQRPDEFYPPHFLDENGKFCPKKNGFIPFSIGRRVCPGENLARQTMFLFGSALLQTFVFEAPEGEVLSTQRDPAERMIIIPKPFRVIMRQRC